MRFKRLLSTALAAALTVGLLTLPASAASFSDLYALPEVSEAAEFLRLMGVVNGVPGGSFNPSGTLSRAEFCAMAVRALDREDEEPAQRSRTIYLDVGPTFWATGYINLASIITLGDSSEGSTPLVAGVGDGTFQPDRAITYGEAVTILCRMLGYGVKDVSTGGAWYDGYLAAGATAGLTDGLSLGGADVITRGQAAILFYNLYFSKTKGGKDTYLVTMGGKEVEGGVVLDVNATADDGTTGAVKTTEGIYKTDRSFDESLVGRKGKALLDADGKLLAFSPKENTTQKVVNAISVNATYLMAPGSEKITVEPNTVVYQKGEATTWEKVWANLSTPAPVTFHYDADGKLSYLFFSSASEEDATVMVARSTPSGNTNPFAALASGGTYTMYKNGMEATAADVRQYDVATFDAGTRVIQVSDLKLTGIYEDASPNPTAPITIKVMGRDFPVLSSARKDLEAFKIGDQLTLLLTTDGGVAGVVSADVVKGSSVGVASVSDGAATVKLLYSGLEVSGLVSSAADRLDNQLVTVTSNTRDRLSLAPISGSAARDDLDVSARKLGDREVAENVLVYDRVKDGDAVAVDYDSLTQATISRSKISFVSYDYAGRVKCLVLDDATGDAYTYGYFSYSNGEREKIYEQIPVLDENGNPKMENGKPVMEDNYDKVIGYKPKEGSSPTLCVRQGGSDGAETTSSPGKFIGTIRNNTPGGVAYDSKDNIAATVSLQSLSGVARSAFDTEEMTVTVGGVLYPVSETVQCYNKTTKTWFKPGKEGMEAARAYSDDLTLYYDRSPAEGGKIRMIVAP